MPFNDKCLYVKGLSVDTNAEDLKRIFGKAGHVQTVKKISPQTAIVVFAEPAGAKQAIEILNRSQINGKTIVVEYKKDKKKNRSQSSQQAPHQTLGCTHVTSDRTVHESPSEESEDDCDSNHSGRNTTDDRSISGRSTDSFVSNRRGRGGLNFSRRGNASEHGVFGRRPPRGNIRGRRVVTGATHQYTGTRDPSPTGSTASDGNAGGFLGEDGFNQISNRRGRGWRRANRRRGYRGGSRQNSSLVADVPDFATAHVDPSDVSETASESSENEDASSYFKETRKVERYKLRLLTARHKLDQLKSEMHIDVVSNLKESSISVEGPKSKVFQTFSVIEGLLDNMICTTDSVTDQFKICFRSFTAKEVVEKFKEKHIYAGWDCANGELHVCGDRQRDATIAMDLIKSLVCEASYPIEGELSARQQDYVANGGRFYTLKAKLVKEQANSCLQIQYHVPSQKIQFALKSSGDLHAVIQALDNFFSPCNVFEGYLDVDAETAKLLLANKDYVLLQCSEGATIDLDRLTWACNCHIQSTSAESLQQAKGKLLETINQKQDRAVRFEKPGDTAWLLSAMGKAKVDDINKLCRSVSSMRISKLPRARSPGLQITTYVPKPAPRKNVNSGFTSSDQTVQSRSPSPPRAPPRAPPQTSPPPSGILGTLASIFSKKKPQPPTPTTSSTNITSPKPPSASVVLPHLTPTTVETLFKLEIVSNDICSVPAEGIVSSQGAIAKSIEGKGSPGLKLYTGVQNVQLSVGSQWKSVRVYHLQTNSWSGAHSVQKLEQNIKDAFQTLSLYQVTTMAFPAIGTGALNYPTDVVAVTMINTLLQCLEETPSVRKVTIAIHPSAPLVYQVFKDHYARHSTDVIVPLRVPMYTPSKRVTVTFTSLRLADAKEAEERLMKELSLHVTSVNWASSPHRSAIGDLSQKELDTIYERAVSCDVKVVFDLSGNNIELDGQKDAVTKLREEINQILHKKPPAPVGAASLPNHWDQSALVAGSYEVELSRTSEEFRTVFAKFHKTCEKHATIFKITRIQNEHLYTQYQAQKSKVLKDLGGDKSIDVERELWHGTSAESTKLICANEFNRSFAGKNGVAYGIGTYFSVSSNYSISYSSDTDYKYLILAKVATGRYMRGDRTTERKNLPQGYHSTVDSTSNPKIFVVYHDAAAYPEYVVKYTADQFLL